MTDLAVYQPGATPAPITDPSSVDSWVLVVSDVIKIANIICDTPFVPDGLRGSGPAVAAAILAGREMGLGIMTSLANIDVIKGKPTQKALLMRAMVQGKGHKWQDVDVTDTRVVIRACRKGEAEWTEVTFTADQAKKAGIDLGKYPADKLYARATSRLARRKFADVIMGMPYSAEDLEDSADAEAADVGTLTEAASNGHAPDGKPPVRTARRARTTATDRPTTAAPAAATAPTTAPVPAQTAPSGDGPPLPPLPGEDEPGPTAPAAPASVSSVSAAGEPDETTYDTPGTVTTAQLTATWTIFTKVYGFTSDDDDKVRARSVAAHIIGRDLASTRDMSKNEANAVLDTLSNWRELAEKRGVGARELLVEMMALGGQAGESDG